MKRLIGLTAVVLAVLAVSISHLALAQSPPIVFVCHLVKATTHPDGSTTVVGHVIPVPVSAVSSHLGHGDMVIGGAPPPAGACCSFRVPAAP